MMNDSFKRLREWLHRAGNAWYEWTTEGRLSSWAKVGETPLPLSGAKNLYFGVNPSKIIKPNDKRTTLEDIAAINCAFCDFDSKLFSTRDHMIAHIRGLPIKPSVVVNSSQVGLHVYWLLKEPYLISGNDELTHAKIVQARWVDYTGGDKGAHDLTRVLRVPGSLNYKYSPPSKVSVIFSDYSRLYSLDQIESVLPKPKERPAVPERHYGKGYAEKALKIATERVLNSIPDSNRNDTLNKSAFWMREFVERGELLRSQVEGSLLCAALVVGLPEHEAERTIASGLKIK